MKSPRSRRHNEEEKFSWHDVKTLRRNRGAIALSRQQKTEPEISSRVGCSRALVGYWLRGERLPSTTHRLTLEKLYKIPRNAWDEATSRRAATKSVEEEEDESSRDVEAAAASEVQTSARAATPDPPKDASARTRAIALARDVDELREEIRKDGEATPLERAKVYASCAATLKLLGTMTGETLEISEARILRLPAWTRIQDALVRALTPFGKETLLAVGQELQRLGGGQVE